MQTRIAMLGGLLLVMQACQKPPETARAQFRLMVEAVYASGHVVPLDEHRVFSQTEGLLLERPVNAGDRVQAGQTLFRIQAEEQDIRVANSREALRTAEANAEPVLAELRQTLAAAEARLRNDSLTYARQTRLLPQGATTQAEHDRAQAAWTAARSEASAIRARMAAREQQLGQELDNARANYRLSQAGRGYYLVQATRAGRVYQVFREPGELVRRGEALALLGDAERYFLRLTVDESDIARIRVGQEIDISLESYPGQAFKATLTKILPAMQASSQSFEVEATFVQPPANLYAGLTVEANIVTARKDRALVVPKKALFAPDSLRVRQGEATRAIHVRTGAADMLWVEILEGVAEGQEIIL